jgi:sulfoxide reductase heme-binding subunit YedZ
VPAFPVATMPVYLYKPLLFLICLGPLAWMGWGLYSGALQHNPVEALLHASGEWTLRLLLATLAVTPLRRLSGWRRPVLWRRMLGLFSFFYAVLHFAIWLVLDRELLWREVLVDLTERPYIMVGFAAFLILLSLAATSNAWSMRHLGANWKRLHRLAYLAALLGVLHYWWLVKADVREPLIYLGVFVLLMVLRLPIAKRRSP